MELQFIRGRYEGSYRWTQPGLHTVSVSLDQEAVVGSPFTVEALAALPEIRELESNEHIGDINGILTETGPERLGAGARDAAAEPSRGGAGKGHAPEAMARMMNGMYPSATAQILAALDTNTAASAVSAMSEEKAREALAAMAPGDVAAITRAMSPGDMRGKADVIARTLLDMSEEDADSVLAATIGSMGDGTTKATPRAWARFWRKCHPRKPRARFLGVPRKNKPKCWVRCPATPPRLRWKRCRKKRVSPRWAP